MLILLETMVALLAAIAVFIGLMAATAAPPVILALIAGLGLAIYMSRRADARAIARSAGAKRPVRSRAAS
ncbi:hypothetical protein [Rhodobacter sp. NSM]|uniref:hypothetical protein n=1 Tax=Rhodobacter sp. NSM TaxID=3457501 RepID=UPI003FD1609E